MCLIATGIGWGAVGAWAAEPPQPDAARITQWVKQLDADQFVIRETATRNLIETGSLAVEPIVQALDSTSLEVTTRGIYVLRELALSNDLDKQDAAQTALEQVAASQTSSAAARAVDTLKSLAGIRQERALAELRELGANVSLSIRQIGLQAAEVTAVDIDESWRGKPDDLRRLRWLQDVQQITFTGRHVHDGFLEHLGQMKGLTSVVIKRTEVTAEGLVHLAALDSLRELDVKYSPVGDDAVRHLQGLTRLGIVKLYGTKMTREAAERLDVALPETEVDFRRGAFLGVACDQPPAPCAVLQVVPNTAAARAGIMEGDVIVEYAGKPVVDFESLKELIGTNEPGESVAIRVARGGNYLSRELDVAQRRGLGVSEGKEHPLGLEIKAVQAGSPAATLGLRVGDVVLRFDGRPVRSLNDLQQAMAAVAEEEDGELTFCRDVRVVSAKVTFGEWE